jgi:serine/threonine protein phosphatase PrpC
MGFSERGPQPLSKQEIGPRFETHVEQGLFELKDAAKQPPKQMEDAGHIDAARGVACACDGMGGGAAAEYASQAAIRMLKACLEDEALYPGLSCPLTETVQKTLIEQEAQRLVGCLNQVVYQEKQLPEVAKRAAELVRLENKALEEKNPEAFAQTIKESIDANQTTFALSKIFQTPDGKTHALCVSVGDSRVYLRRKGVWTQVSHDHSYSQSLLKLGLIANETDREQLVFRADIEKALNGPLDTPTREALIYLLDFYTAERETELPLGFFNWSIYESLGRAEHEVNPYITFIELEDGDELYTMTDGPYENLSPKQFEELRQRVVGGDLQTICQLLCQAAQDAGLKNDDSLIAGQRVKFVPVA